MSSNRRERILANKRRLECLGFTNAETGGDSDCDADDEEDKLRDVGLALIHYLTLPTTPYV